MKRIYYRPLCLWYNITVIQGAVVIVIVW